MLSLLYMMRSVTMYATVLPLANDHVYCSPKLNTTSFGEMMLTATTEVIKLIAAGGLGFMGKKTMCGDYIFSGHTIIFMMTYLLIRECKRYVATARPRIIFDYFLIRCLRLSRELGMVISCPATTITSHHFLSTFSYNIPENNNWFVMILTN